MRVLLDEHVDRLLKELFAPEFTVLTVQERGWRGKANSELVRAAQQEFDALVTMDGNLEHQQRPRGAGPRRRGAAGAEQRFFDCRLTDARGERGATENPPG